MKDFEFYQNFDLKYPELAICIEDSRDGIAKFYIPVLTPLLNSNEPYDKIDNYINKSNILSDSSAMEINACTSSNYLELRLPEIEVLEGGIKYGYNMVLKPGVCYKGDIFVVIFVGGDPNKPYLLGRYYNAINQ